MSAFDKMLANMLKDALPPEVLAIMTPENIDKLITGAKELKETLLLGQQTIMDEQAAQRAMLEELLNDLDGNSGEQPGRGAASNDTDGTGSGDGPGN